MLVQGAGLSRVGAADRPVLVHRSAILSFGYLDVNAGAASRAISVLVSDAGEGPVLGAWRPAAGDVDRSQRRSGSVHARERWDRSRQWSPAPPRGRHRATTSGSSSSVVGVWSGGSRTFSVTRPQLTGAGDPRSNPVQTGDTRTGRRSRPCVPLADAGLRGPLALRSRSLRQRRRRGEGLYPRHRPAGGQRRGRHRPSTAETRRPDHLGSELERPDPPVVPELARRERRAGVLRGSRSTRTV